MPLTNEHIEALLNPDATRGRRAVIRAVDVKKVYKTGTQETHVLRGATVDIYDGEYLSIIGPSGSSKSTLFNQIGALDQPNEGKVELPPFGRARGIGGG